MRVKRRAVNSDVRRLSQDEERWKLLHQAEKGSDLNKLEQLEIDKATRNDLSPFDLIIFVTTSLTHSSATCTHLIGYLIFQPQDVFEIISALYFEILKKFNLSSPLFF